MGGTAAVTVSSPTPFDEDDDDAKASDDLRSQSKAPNATIPAKLSNPILWNQPSSLGISWNGNVI